MLKVSNDVQRALDARRPVVALESTIISHGLPYPRNLAVARRLEAIVREGGATPATIAVICGEPRVGLGEEALEILADPAHEVEKCSTRDLPVVCARGRHGATTVAATCHLAAMAGVSVFATGGIGGAHRHAERTLDVSADLRQLARSPVAVVSAGAKAILDLGLTLEVLETLGVPVVGYRTDRMPAFYSPDSPHPLTQRVDDVPTLAALIRAHRALGLSGGQLICNPIPPDAAISAEEVEGWIQQALVEAEAQGVHGKALTPFLLPAIVEHSGGRALEANVALVEHNVRLATSLAVALAA